MQIDRALDSWQGQAFKGYVYAIYTEDPHFWKIGVSEANPLKRLANLQTGCPIKIRFWGAMLVYHPFKLEKAIHKYLLAYKAEGEWFKHDAEVEKIASALRDNDKSTLKCVVDMKKVKIARLKRLLDAIDKETA